MAAVVDGHQPMQLYHNYITSIHTTVKIMSFNCQNQTRNKKRFAMKYCPDGLLLIIGDGDGDGDVQIMSFNYRNQMTNIRSLSFFVV